MKSVGRALEVLELISDLQPIGLSEIARQLDEPKSSVQRALDTLSKGRWIARDETNSALWTVAVRTAMLGRNFTGKLDITAIAQGYMEALRQETQETIHLAIPREASMILIERLESPHRLRYVEPLGGAASIFRTATGKSVLAHLPSERRDELIDGHLSEIEEAGHTRESLIEELDAILQRGYSTTSSWRNEVHASAAVITGLHGEPVAALSISAPATRVTEELKPVHARLISEAAREISRRLQTSRRHGSAGSAGSDDVAAAD